MKNNIVDIVDLIKVLNDKVEKTSWYILTEEMKGRFLADLGNINTIYQVYYTTTNDNPLNDYPDSHESQGIIFIGKVGIRYYYDEDSYEEREEYFITFANKVNGEFQNDEKITYFRRNLLDEKYIEGKDLSNLFKKVQIKVSDLDGVIRNWFTKLEE